MSADPTRTLLSMDLLDDDDHDRLDEWGNRAVLTEPAAEPVSIPVVFAVQVERAPETVALVCRDRSWTYRELDQITNRIAHLLAGNGAGPGEVVGLLVPRSGEAIIGLLAILKTGAAYLPIDPAHPDERIKFMVSDAGPVAVLTTADLGSRFEGLDVSVIEIDDPLIDGQPSSALPTPEPDDLAYMTYTSGTTGVPKAVAVTHHNVTQLVDAVRADLPARPGEVWSQWHSLVFDVSVWEIWGALLHGGRLVVVSRIGGLIARRPPRAADQRKGQRALPNPFGGRNVVTGTVGVDDAHRRGRGLPARTGGPVGDQRPHDDQRLRADRGHDLCGDEWAVDPRLGRGTDRFAGARGGTVRSGQVAASGARRSGR